MITSGGTPLLCLYLFSIGLCSELYDVTTIYRVDEPAGEIETGNNPVSVEIHARTNALGLPFLAGGRIAEPDVGIDVPRCESLYYNLVNCEWDLKNWEWTRHHPTAFLDTGEWSQLKLSSAAKYNQFNDYLNIKFSGTVQYSDLVTIILTSNTAFLQEQEKFYLIRMAKSTGKFLYQCDNRVFDRHFMIKDIDGDSISVFCERVATFTDDLRAGFIWDGLGRTVSDTGYEINNYLHVEIKDGRIKIWLSKVKSSPMVNWLDQTPIDVRYFAIQLSSDYHGGTNVVAVNHGKGQVLSLAGSLGSLTSPWINLSTNKICVSVVYYSVNYTTPVLLNVIAENGESRELGLLKTDEDGWKVERLVTTVPETMEEEAVKVVLKTVKNEGKLEIQRIAGCNTQENEDIAVIPSESDIPSERMPYNVAVSMDNDIIQRLNARYDCENGGLGFDKKKCACPAGFTGDRCEIGCGANSYGTDCGGVCSYRMQGCRGLTMCTPVVGCLCAPGFKGYFCNITCSSKEYGPGCNQHCDNCLGECNIYTGVCLTSCKPGFYAPYCRQTYAYTRYAPHVNASDFGELTVTPNLESLIGEGTPAFFQVQYKLADLKEWTVYSSQIVPQGDETVEDILMQGLESGNTYNVRIVLIDKDLSSYESNLIPYTTALTKCVVPEEVEYNLDATTTDTTITISWSYEVGDVYRCPVVNYELSWQEGWRWLTYNVSVTNAELTDKLPGSEFKIRVRALTVSEYAPYSETVSVTTKEYAPGPVKDLHVVSRENDSVTLQWSPPKHSDSSQLNYVISYECEKHAACNSYCGNGGEAHIAENIVKLIDMLPLSQYTVTVTSVGREDGGNSTILVATTQSDPVEVPEQSTILPQVTNTSMTVFWEPVEVCTSFFLGYNYQLFKSDEEDVITSGSTTDTNITFNELSAKTEYTVRVFVYTSSGWNPFRYLEINVTTKASMPTQVEDLTVYKRSRYLLGLQWAKPNATYGDLASFTIKYGVGEPTKNISVEPKHCLVWPDLYCYTLQGLTADQLYTIAVSARNTEVSEDGEEATVTGLTKESAPDPPENIQLLNVTATSLAIQWEYPRLSNGIIRSFLLNVEEIEQLDQTQCCQQYPVSEVVVTSEQRYFEAEISGLHPASAYIVSVSAKTAWFGPGQSIRVYTKPPVLHVHYLPNVTVPTNDTITWIPQAEVYITGNPSTLYDQLIIGNILLVLTNTTENSHENSGITNVNIYTAIKSCVNSSFFLAAEYNTDDEVVLSSTDKYTGQWGEINNWALMSGSVYQLAAVQIAKYGSTYSVDIVLSEPFTATTEPKTKQQNDDVNSL